MVLSEVTLNDFNTNSTPSYWVIVVSNVFQ